MLIFDCFDLVMVIVLKLNGKILFLSGHYDLPRACAKLLPW